MSKILKFEDDARESLIKGACDLAKAVKSTLGAAGRTVCIEDDMGGSPKITKDGVTVAKSIDVPEKFEQMGVRMLKDIAINTNENVGDGTTTSIVLAEALLQEGNRLLKENNANPVLFQRGLDKAVSIISKYLDTISQEVELSTDLLKHIATTSANNDVETGELIYQAFEKIGRDGLIEVEHSTDYATSITHETGMKFDRGLLNPYFVTDLSQGKAILKDTYILITDNTINSIAASFRKENEGEMDLITEMTQKGKNLVIIADDFGMNALQVLTKIKLERGAQVFPVKAPEFGERRVDALKDIAALTGGTFISKDIGKSLNEVIIEDLGIAKNVEIERDSTLILKGRGTRRQIKERIDLIKAEIEKSTDTYNTDKLKSRLSKLTNGVAIIKVGANSEIELKELADRVEDSVNACKAALDEGVIVGGGVALYNIATNVLPKIEFKVKEDELAIEALKYALEAPIKTILSNGGIEGDNYIRISNDIAKDGNSNYGYDIRKREFADLFERGILDPVKVTKTALSNAVSIVGTMLTTNAVVVNDSSESTFQYTPPKSGTSML